MGRVSAVAAAAAATALPLRETAPAAPRRAPRPAPAPRPAKRARGDLPLGARLVGWVRALPDHRVLDRLIGGRLWIVLIGTLLVGLVTLQLSLLKLNAGIGEAVQKSAQLEEQNRALRIAISQLEDSERVIAAASQMGLVMPPQGSPRFLNSGSGDVGNALRTMRAPDPAAAAAAAATVADQATTADAGTTTDLGAGVTTDGADTAATAGTTSDDGTAGVVGSDTSGTTAGTDGAAAAGTTGADGAADTGTTGTDDTTATDTGAATETDTGTTGSADTGAGGATIG